MSGKISRNFTIFGGTGDLTYRKLIPALYNLYAENKIDDNDRIVIIGRRVYTTEKYIEIIKSWCEEYSRVTYKDEMFYEFTKNIVYHLMDFKNLSEYQGLSDLLTNVKQNIFYFAVAPRFFSTITNGIKTLNIGKNIKLVVEKPFGENLEDAEILNDKLEMLFGKNNIYRIDHYLGKEMVQNLQTIRFSNQIFKSSWNRDCIEKIEIIAYEEVGVESRASYYDKSGALKDMVQNHLMQLLSLIAMEEPNYQHDIKSQQQKVFEALRPVDKLNINNCLILGQYDGYLSEQGVNDNSFTETYAECEIFVDNNRWYDVPFYIKTGKRMATREMKVVITFKPTLNNQKSDILVIKVQPTEGVRLEFNIKVPGDSVDTTRAEMDFCQNCVPHHKINTPEAYERLLFSILNDDQSLFSTWDHIKMSWQFINELKQSYENNSCKLIIYKQGSSKVL